jgi:oxysterol-binding protein-related protein 3/6/7
LGETYEYITKEMKYYSETVSHHPPIFAMNVETDSYEINRICETSQSFNGTSIEVTDHNRTEIVFKAIRDKPSVKFSFSDPKLVVGNLMGIGGRYVEP